MKIIFQLSVEEIIVNYVTTDTKRTEFYPYILKLPPKQSQSLFQVGIGNTTKSHITQISEFGEKCNNQLHHLTKPFTRDVLLVFQKAVNILRYSL